MTDLTPNDLSPQGEHALGPAPLSPAAQEVLDAYFTHADLLNREVSHEEMIAAALRAVVLQCEYCDDYGTSFIDPKDLLAIANELEGQGNYSDAMKRALTALATPPPEPPTQADLLRLLQFNPDIPPKPEPTGGRQIGPFF